MSTMSTIAHGDNFHLYNDLADPDDRSAVYLELTRAEFEATPNRVMVRIPRDVWDAIVDAESKQRERHAAWLARTAACEHEWREDRLFGVHFRGEYCVKCHVRRGQETAP